MKRTIESYIIYLREDLRIADSCHLIKDRLLEAILNGSYLSKEFAGYFTRANPNLPFAISATDPDQVAILKKLINALENTEKTLRSIEDLDIRRERYTPALLKDAIKTSYYAIHEIYAVLQIINTSNADIQNIIAPYLKTLLPKMALASQALNQFSPQHHGEQAAALLGQAVTMLPTEYTTPYQGLGNISSLIFQLPQYFEKLQQLISTGISGIADLSITTPREYQERIERETKELQDHLHSFTTKNGVRAFPSFLLIVKKLVSHSSELINSAAPLTKTAYNNAVKQLHKIKHDLLPQLLAELEMMEESMGLKTGILTDAVLQQIDASYTSLSDQVQKIAMASGILDATSETMSESLEKLVRFIANDRGQLDTGPKITPELQLSVMMDDVFIEKRRDAQLTRLSEARLEAENTSALEAASRFLAK